MSDFYYLLFPENWNLLRPDKTVADHYIFKTNNSINLSPVTFDSSAINLENLTRLIKAFPMENIIILDRIRDKRPVTIRDHINGSGINFLRGDTPFQDRTQFPDMSHVYRPHPFAQPATVFTAGPTRFHNIEIPDLVISEAAGIISPLWHYLDISVCGFGIPEEAATNFFTQPKR
ncbi:MAG: hypothetical protein ACE5D8_00145 [Fidelibacterota bacterium]